MLEIAGKSIGYDSETFVTFEVGPTHNGLNSAKKLVKQSKKAGADAVKFQIFDVDKLISDKKQIFSYKILESKDPHLVKDVSEPLYTILKRRCLEREEWVELKSYCNQLDICFFATVFSESDVDFVKNIGCESIKIASADLNYTDLLIKAAESNLVIQIDTGMSTLEEIEKAVKTIEKAGNKKIIIHHCPTGYPASLKDVNLNIISNLKKRFRYPIAYSDHNPGYDMDLAAIALGASLIEKTITEDRTTPSVEHIMSLEPDEFQDFISTVKTFKLALGSKNRTLDDSELTQRNLLRRSLHLEQNVKKGQTLGEVDFKFKRPGTGIMPDEYTKYLNYKFIKDFTKNHIIKKTDIME